MPFEQTLQFLSQRRPAVCPNDGFQRHARDWNAIEIIMDVRSYFDCESSRVLNAGGLRRRKVHAENPFVHLPAERASPPFLPEPSAEAAAKVRVLQGAAPAGTGQRGPGRGPPLLRICLALLPSLISPLFFSSLFFFERLGRLKATSSAFLFQRALFCSSTRRCSRFQPTRSYSDRTWRPCPQSPGGSKLA